MFSGSVGVYNSLYRLRKSNNNNNNNNTLFTHATSRSDKNSLKHVRETKSIKKKRNNLKIT